MPESRRSRLKPPGGLKGASLMQLHAQQKAEADFDALMKANRPEASALALAQGVAAGAAAPFVFQMIGPMGKVKSKLDEYAQKAHIAHFLESPDAPDSIRVPKGEGALRAESVHRILTRSPTGSQENKKLVMRWLTESGYSGRDGEFHTGKWKLKGSDQIFSSQGDAVRAWVAVNSDLLQGQKVESIQGALGKVLEEAEPPKYPFVGAAPHADLPAAMLSKAEVSYAKSGKKAPSVIKPLLQHLGRSAKEALPATGVFAAMGGAGALISQLTRKKQLKKLVDTYKEKTSQAGGAVNALELTAMPEVPGAVMGDMQQAVPIVVLPPPPDPRIEALKERAKPNIKDLRSVPVILQKQAEAAGRILVQCMFDELEKISEKVRKDATNLELRPKAGDLGIYAKKTGREQRGTAYTRGVAPLAAGGAATGAVAGTLLSVSPTSLARKKGREQAWRNLSSDVEGARGAGEKAKAKFQEIKKTKGTGEAVEEAAKSFGKNLPRGIVGRRLRGGAKGAATGAVLAGGAKVLKNISDYETAKALATRPSPKNPKRASR